MKHKSVIAMGITTLMLVSLWAACAATSVTAAESHGTWTSSSVVGAGTVGDGAIENYGTAVCSWGPNRLDVFATGDDHNLWHRWWAGTWSGWENLGQPSTGPDGIWTAPTVVSWGPGRIDVFVGDYYGNILQLWYQNGWHPWNNLGTLADTSIATSSAPAASSWGSGRLDVFANGKDGNLYQKYYDGSWHRWNSLGNPGTSLEQYSSPGALSTTSWGYNRVDVFVKGHDDTLYQRYWDGAWHWWKVSDTAGRVGSCPSPCFAGPAVCSWGANRLDVFFVDTNKHLQQKWFDGSWHSLNQIGGSQLISGPGGAVTWQQGGATRLDLLMPGDAFALYQKYYVKGGGGWTNWSNLGMIS